MAYVFTRDLETGNAKIDSQHKELFDAMNKLEAACSQGKGRVEVEKTLQFLSDYITKHFGDEETLQRQSGYPDFMKHKGFHETFKKSGGRYCGGIQKGWLVYRFGGQGKRKGRNVAFEPH